MNTSHIYMLIRSITANIVQLIPVVSQSFKFQFFNLNSKSSGGILKLLNFTQWYASEKFENPFFRRTIFVCIWSIFFPPWSSQNSKFDNEPTINKVNCDGTYPKLSGASTNTEYNNCVSKI